MCQHMSAFFCDNKAVINQKQCNVQTTCIRYVLTRVKKVLTFRFLLYVLVLFIICTFSILLCFEVVYFNSDIHTSIWVVTCYNKSFMSRTDGTSSSHFLRALLVDTIVVDFFPDWIHYKYRMISIKIHRTGF